MYQSLILLARDAEFDRLEESLAARFRAYPEPARPSFSRTPDGLRVNFSGYEFMLSKNSSEWVQKESAEIAELAAASQREAVAKVTVRLELSGGSDPNMEHFNDYIAILEATESLGQIWIFDPAAGEFV